MTDENRSREEILAELSALRSELAELKGDAPEAEASDESQSGISRRKVLGTAWVAPVVVTVGAEAGAPSPPAATTTAGPTTQRPTASPTNPRPWCSSASSCRR